MLKHRQLTLKRLNLTADSMREALYGEVAKLDLSCFAAPGRISFEQAITGTYQPISTGHQFGPPWSTHWVRMHGTVPGEWAGHEVHLRWDSLSEAALWDEGRVLQGFSPKHHMEYVLHREAIGEEAVDFYVEVACNNLFGVDGPHEDPIELTPIGVLRRGDLAVFRRGVWDLLWDFVTIKEMAEERPEGDPRGSRALRVADEMVNRWSPDAPEDTAAAREVARGFLKEGCGDGAFRLNAVGHAHIDTAWLWPIAETHRKCYRSFATALRYMEEYPAYRFVCSQAQQWAWMKEEQPELFARMKQAAEAGRFIPVGGSWIEPDCNIPSGESLIRQFLYGKRFFERELGTECRTFWNPDVFGYSGQLPQILKHCEIDNFLTQKLSWNQFNKLPHHAFFWEAIDGTTVLTHFPPADSYNACCTVKELLYAERNFLDQDRTNEALHLFGIGDGGGGPTREMLERLERAENLNGLPRVAMDSPASFFERLEQSSDDLLSWRGELYLELHRGTYTTQARNKWWNRKCEQLLGDIDCLAAVLGDEAAPKSERDRLWTSVLLNQFHDIIPGSSIREVYQDSEADYTATWAAGNRLRNDLVQRLAGGAGSRVLVTNTLSRPRTEVVALPDGVEGHVQTSPDGERLAVVQAPGLGYAITAPTNTEASVSGRSDGDGFILENEFVRVQLDAAGRLVSLYDKPVGRESVPAGERGNNLVWFEDRPAAWEAWDVDVYHLDSRTEWPAAESARLLEDGPLRAAVEYTYAFEGRSRVRQVVRLTALSPRLDFETEVDWHESRRFLKVEFPWDIHADHATYEIQFGHLQRPTHFNTSWDMARFEVCGHRWADLSEHGYGVALLNDSKYGYSCHGNVIRLSLLRSPKHPDREADMGRHQFTYAVYPHAGSFQDAGLVDEAAALNRPLLLRSTGKPEESVNWFAVDQEAIVVDTVKRAEDSEHLVLRLYESFGARHRVRLTSSLPVARAFRCTAMERGDQPLDWKEGGVDLEFSPFQLITLKVERTPG